MFPWLSRICLILYLVWLPGARGKWVEGRVDTKDNWAFLARFCFLSVEGQFEYLIEFDRDMGMPNLLLYYDDNSQWPAVYHSSKTCKEREAILNKAGQNQIIRLSHWYPDTEYSGCIVTKENKELPATKSSTTTPKPTTTNNPFTTTAATTKRPKNNTKQEPSDPSFYNKFLKTTTVKPKTTITDGNSTTWYELVPTDGNFSTVLPEDELWENIGPDGNTSRIDNLKDVELLFDNRNGSGPKIKRSTFELYERFRRRRLKSENDLKLSNSRKGNTERLIVSCHNSRRFRSARERWWFIAISSCDSTKGLDIRYKFLMTNGPDGDFWHEHFSADEFYVLPVLLAYTFAYVIVMIAVVMCSVELKSRHLLHSTYKLFLVSVTAQHAGVLLQSLAYIRYAANGVGADNARIVGQFLCGVSEMSFLLLLTLLAKGYTVTRGRLRVGFTVKLTVFMCAYIGTYIVLFVYQAKAFDPGEVLYLYESPAGYGLIVLRVLAWCMFAYSTFFTVKKYPEKNMFYCPFFICGTLWFHAGPLFILTANSYIDKWVRESVVTAVLLFITFSGHVMFLLLTLPVFANKNFPYHVRTTQIGIMEVTGNGAIDGFGHNAYHPSNGAPQTVIIPLTRRTEELIGNMYSQYMASAPTLPLDHSPMSNGLPKSIYSNSNSLPHQDSTDTNNSDDIRPYLPKDTEDDGKAKPDPEIFTVANQMSKLDKETTSQPANLDSLPTERLPLENVLETSRSDLPSVLRSRRNILEPIKMEVPSWSLAKGPGLASKGPSVVGVIKKKKSEDIEPPMLPSNGTEPNGTVPASGIEPNGTLPQVGKKVPSVKNGLPSSGEISTILEGHVQSYPNTVSKATIDLFSVSGNKL